MTSTIRENDIGHHVSESPGVTWKAAEARQEKVILEVVRPLLSGNVGVCVEHI